MGRPQNQITELLHLHTRLEWKLEFAALDDNIGEVEEMDFQWIQHALSSDDNLLRLLFHWKGSNESSNLFGRLPFGELSETLLTSPNARVDDLEEELPRPRVEDEDGTVDGLGRQITLERLVTKGQVSSCLPLV